MRTLDLASCTAAIMKARALIANDADGEFPFPDMRAVDLAVRLVAAGPKACAVSASECHEITENVLTAYDRDAFPVQARSVIGHLVNCLEAALAEIEHTRGLVPPDHRWRAAPPTVEDVRTFSWWWNRPSAGDPHILQFDVDNGKIVDVGEASIADCVTPFDPTDWPGAWAPCITPDGVEAEMARFERLLKQNAPKHQLTPV